MPAARAISTLCSTTLVEPPMAMATVTALRSEAGVTMSLGRMPFSRHGEEAVDHLVGEVGEAAGVVRRRRHHMKWLEAQHRDERLHGVVGEHAAAAALAGAGVQRVSSADVLGLVGHLEGRHEVDGVAGRRVDAGVDGAVGEDDGGRVVLEDGGERADRGLVAGDDGDEAGDAVGGQVDVGHVVDELSAYEGEAHLRRAVELPVRHARA